MPQRAVIVLQQTAPQTYAYLLRADVPAAHQPFFANAAYVSPFKPIAPDADPDLTGLQSGAVVETQRSVAINGATLAQLQTRLVLEQADYQQHITADPTWAFYGTFYNGTAWTRQGV